MDPFLLIEWVGANVAVADPPRVGLAWPLEELESTTEDPEDLESDREVYDRGWRWCVCYSAREPGGEKGFIPEERLLPLSAIELEAARAASRADLMCSSERLKPCSSVPLAGSS